MSHVPFAGAGGGFGEADEDVPLGDAYFAQLLNVGVPMQLEGDGERAGDEESEGSEGRDDGDAEDDSAPVGRAGSKRRRAEVEGLGDDAAGGGGNDAVGGGGVDAAGGGGAGGGGAVGDAAGGGALAAAGALAGANKSQLRPREGQTSLRHDTRTTSGRRRLNTARCMVSCDVLRALRACITIFFSDAPQVAAALADVKTAAGAALIVGARDGFHVATNRVDAVRTFLDSEAGSRFLGSLRSGDRSFYNGGVDGLRLPPQEVVSTTNLVAQRSAVLLSSVRAIVGGTVVSSSLPVDQLDSIAGLCFRELNFCLYLRLPCPHHFPRAFSLSAS